MFNISNNDIITITRGDTAVTDLVINLGTILEPLVYDLGENDKVFFALCEPNKLFEQAILKKVYTSEDYNYDKHSLKLTFKHLDTAFLLPGVYYYSIKLYRPETNTIVYEMDSDSPEDITPSPFHTDTKIDTIIDRRKFIILE